MVANVERSWLVGLVAILAVFYLALGLEIGGATGFVGMAGGISIAAALIVRRRSRPLAGALLLVGAAPFAVLLWWSVVVPALALVTVVLGAVLVLRTPSKARVGLAVN